MTDQQTTPTPCARGCTITDRHLTPCTCLDDGHEHTTPIHPHDDGELCDDQCRWCDECDGCQPRQVETGLLCRACAGRVRRALLDLPERVEWIVANVIPGQGEEGQRVTGSREAPVPLNLTAVDDADEAVTVLTELAQAHADATGLTVPDLRLARATTRHNPADGYRPTWRAPRVSDHVTGVRNVAAAPHLTATLTRWHLTYFDSIASRPYAVDWHDQLTVLERKLRGRYPTTDRATKVPVPCPECKRLMLHLHPPKEAPEYKADGTFLRSHDITVICHADDCGKVMPSAEYWRVKRSAMTDAYEKAQGST